KSGSGSESVIYFEGLKELTEWDKNLIEVFCMNVSVAFENIYLNQEMEDTQKEIIFTIGEIAEARSQETGFHVKRVGEYSKLLALKYGLSEPEAEIIRLASPMHDVGKLGIMDAILNKPDLLTAQEFEVVKQHVRVGHEMLKNSSRTIMRAAAIIALQHHERYDGGGYPSGLKGEEIHIYGRITAIADVFDALGCERVYKKAWPTEEILDYFREQRGRQFDPRLVDIFFDNLEEILRIRVELKDS
ncbi:MAG TPA: HD domain-containing phosphohydrolase, partial [Patescibacteria group bacterium]|nr:HD domain-containing phosphohydrolase [Patescibacteria group bacterium]